MRGDIELMGGPPTKENLVFSDKFGSLKIGLHHFCVFGPNCCQKLQFENRCEIGSGSFLHSDHNDKSTIFIWDNL